MPPPASVGRIPIVSNSDRIPVEPTAIEAQATVQPSSSDTAVDDIDRSFHAALARLTGGVSPAALALAFADWQLHLLASPGKQASLAGQAIQNAFDLVDAMLPRHAVFQPWSVIRPLENDRRFTGSDWELPSFNLLAQAFLLNQQWWHSTTTGIHGLAHSNAAIADFALRQCLDTVAPTNFAISNPEVLRKIMETGGGNFVYGLHNFVEDWQALLAGGRLRSDQTYVVGKDVAITPGKVVYRNELIELIQYSPTTSTVRAEPVLIVPAWIMKYYILDLTPRNSLVRYLVESGFTVFMISWKNPTPEYRNFSLEDYRELGVDAAITTINSLRPGQAIHAAGYCLGGTLLSIAAARLARERPDCLRTVTLLAAQTDFTEAGELTLFINESQVAFLEDMMWRQGLLATAQMAGAFQMLRTNDLLWSRVVRDYLIGERAAPSELMSWNADATRMPYQMHSDYLRRLFLNNDLAEGRYQVNGRPVSLADLHIPMFVVGTLRDHVAPWKSTYKINFLADADITYVLTSGGHNAGIVAPPGQEGHSYQVRTKKAHDPYLGPDEWIKRAPSHEGSWWAEWTRFLAAHSGQSVPSCLTADLGQKSAPLDEAPGSYVLEP
ncbi:PHA/PHB synthase family protein [Bradyrhizobium japonicum]|uniref:PHA/PHB synthase family protein n=1 Tax=Bradyrhizobium japonicum TaxID=375 RepID=UPI001BAB225A|nr:alpha/beta fold hydrolase [Bradyrhizobium japonicum]MBR0914648.1 polyhydroxyalkanoic acid synthase [Bradyrhizobium japonicum]